MCGERRDASEIEITPEMIEAGAEIVGGFDRELDLARETAVNVFQAMWLARLDSCCKPS